MHQLRNGTQHKGRPRCVSFTYNCEAQSYKLLYRFCVVQLAPRERLLDSPTGRAPAAITAMLRREIFPRNTSNAHYVPPTRAV